jgi:predicted aconitase with swiveling domain
VAEALTARTLVPGEAEAPVTLLSEPLSFWGGLDPLTGRVIDRRHPQAGTVLSGRILAMPAGRGSSSASSVLAEAIRLGTAPSGVVLRVADPIVALGALVAAELYGIACPVVTVSDSSYASLRAR